MKEADCEDEAGSKADNRYWNSQHFSKADLNHVNAPYALVGRWAFEDPIFFQPRPARAPPCIGRS
jgi:hypothetical protein